VRVVGLLNGDVSFASMMGRDRNNQTGEVAEITQKRRETNDTYMERLKSLLTPEQFESLPRGGGGGGGRGGNGGGGGGGGGGGMFGSGPIKLSDLPEQAQERMKQFDTNSDGTIDDAERSKMMEAFRNRGGGGGGGGDGEGGGRRRGGNGGNGGGAGGGQGGQGGQGGRGDS
jgi:hypothetical protein